MHKNKKKRNKKNTIPPNKVRKIILYVAIILIIIIVILLTNPTFHANIRLLKINNPDSMDEKMPVPEYLNMAVSIYDGELTPQIIAKTYYNFANKVVPKYYKKCKNMSDEKIEKYFKKHKKIIKIELGYTSQDDFKSFIKSIQDLNGNKLEFEDYRIMSTSVSKINNITNCYLVLQYKNNNEITINTQILNNIQKNQTSILYSTNIKKEELEKAREQEKKEEETLNNYKSPFNRGIPLEMLK